MSIAKIWHSHNHVRVRNTTQKFKSFDFCQKYNRHCITVFINSNFNVYTRSGCRIFHSAVVKLWVSFSLTISLHNNQFLKSQNLTLCMVFLLGLLMRSPPQKGVWQYLVIRYQMWISGRVPRSK